MPTLAKRLSADEQPAARVWDEAHYLARRTWAASAQALPVMTHTDDCCCVWCEAVKTRTPTDVVAWLAAHRYHGAFANTFDEQPFPHERGDWHWLMCDCGARLLVGEHPLQGRQPRRRRA